MLINFTASNILSFNTEINFSMFAGKTRLHSDHIIQVESIKSPKILKSAVLYGANASGKSNLVKAINFAKDFIIQGTKTDEAIPIKPYKLDKKNVNKPSKFEFTFLISNKLYAYGFVINHKSVIEEWLNQIGKTTEKKIYHRKTSNNNEVSIDFNISFPKKNDKQFFEFVARGTRPNKLFLTEAIERNVDYFIEPYRWFRDYLNIIFPDTTIVNIEYIVQYSKNICELFKNFFQYFDTGIDGISTKIYDVENELTEIPKNITENLIKKIKDKKQKVFLNGPNNIRYTVFKNEKNELKAIKLSTLHKMKPEDEEIYFELSEESDGTKRLIDFIPALTEMIENEKVFIIDEINRSLHPSLTYKIFELFFTNSINKKSQLITTTHDIGLLDLDLFRRDEIWFIEKNKDGESSVYSLEEFKPRYDKDIAKGYLLGRFGAIPVVQKVANLGWL